MLRDFPGGSDSKCLPTMWKIRVWSLGQEGPREKEMAPTPVLLPGKSQGRRNLVVYNPWSRKESNTTERLNFPKYWPPCGYRAPYSQRGSRKCGEAWLLGAWVVMWFQLLQQGGGSQQRSSTPRRCWGLVVLSSVGQYRRSPEGRLSNHPFSLSHCTREEVNLDGPCVWGAVLPESPPNPGESSVLPFTAEEPWEAHRWAKLAFHESDVIKMLQYHWGNNHPEMHERTGGWENYTPDVSALDNAWV